MKDSHVKKREIETRTDLHSELLAKGKQKERENIMPNATPREEIAYVGPREANVHLDIRAHSSVTQTRKAKKRVHFVHLLRQVHCSENSKGDGKGGYDGGAEGTPKLTRESPAEKANRRPSLNFNKGRC